MNKTFYKIMGIAITIATPFAVYAAYTGPSATPTGNNTAGPVWLQTGAPVIQTGNLGFNGDAYFSSSKAIRADAAGTTILNMSNYNGSGTGFKLQVAGDIDVQGFGATIATVTTTRLCLKGDTCRTTWPTGGSGTIGGTGTANYIPMFSGATTLGNSSIYMLAGGNVGINNTTAGSRLTVVGGSTDPGAYDDAKGIFVSASTGGPNVGIAEFRHDNLSQGVGIGYASVYATGYNASQNLEVFSRGTAPLTLNVSGGGNVGVGTATVTNKLQVGGGTRAAIGYDNLFGAPTNSTVDSAGDKLVFYNNGTSQSYRIGLGAASDMWYQSAGTHRFLTGATTASIGSDALFLSSGGSAGIGTTGPAYKLDVNGDIIGGWHRSRGATGWYNETYAGGWYMSDASWVRSYNSKNVYTGTGIIASDGSLSVGYGGAAGPASGAVIARTVGIGTSSPLTAAGLDVDFNWAPGLYGIRSSGSSVGGMFTGGNVGINGTSGNVGVSGSGSTAGSFTNSTNGANYAVLGTSDAGARGYGSTYGVYGNTPSAGGYGVMGVNTAGSGGGTGVYGSCSGGNCSGVDGYTSGGGQGVHGSGVTGVRGDGGSTGVSGVGGGTGVYGNGTSYGVNGVGGSYGVYGNGTTAGGIFYGGTYGTFSANADTGAYNSGYTYGTYSSGGVYSYYGASGRMYNAGRTSIGTTAAAVPLTVVADSSVYAQLWAQSNDVNCGYAATAYTDGNFYLNRWCGGASASAYLTPAGNWVAYSDRDLKTDIKKIHYGIDEVMKLKPVTYTRKDDKDHTKLIGFIAQDVKEIMPEFVTGKAISEGGTGLGLNYSGMVTVLAGGIQDQQKEIDELKAQNADLLKRLEALEAKIK